MKMSVIFFVSLFVCANVGMAQQFFIQEDFSTASSLTSANWTVNLLSGNDNGGVGAWRWDNLGLRNISLPIVPPFAMSDSDQAGGGFMFSSALVSDAYDFSMASQLLLDFDYMFRQLAATATIEIFDGVTWNVVSSLAGNDVGMGTNSHESFDLTALAGGATNGRIRFVHSANNDWWYGIDNVSLFSPPPLDLAVEITSPVNDSLGCLAKFAIDETFTLKITNTGSVPYNAGTMVKIDIKVGDPPVSQCNPLETLTLTAILSPGGSISYTTNCKIDLTAIRTKITACIIPPGGGDGNIANNEAKIEYENPAFVPETFGYQESFDGLGTNASGFTMTIFEVPVAWENAPDDGASLAMNLEPDWGPNNGPTGSNQGPPADHTTGTANGNYMYIEDTPSQVGDIEIRSPCLDLNGATGNPTVQFFHFSHAVSGSAADNILEIDVLNESTGVLTPSVLSLPGYGDNQWHQVQVDLSAFAPDVVRVHFRTNNQNANFTDDVAIDDFLFFDAIAPLGQAPQPGNAVFDINNAANSLGQNVASGTNGPFVANMTVGGNMNMTWSGQNNGLILCLFGPGNDNIANFGPAIGQLDIGTLPLTGGIPSLIFVFGDGNLAFTSLFHAFFFTGSAGTGGVNFQVSPVFPPGPLTRFQCVMNPAGQFFISNAVDVIVF